MADHGVHSLMKESPANPLVANDSDRERQKVFQVRPYQLEMLEESMKRNIIVAAETGSGKTFIAILRIQAEIERCSPEKLVWFCVPTVALGIQQLKAISSQIPNFQARLLSGADNVDYWTEQWIWDEVLRDIRIVVSTHQVLLDALKHGFIRMQQLALMVFDEAHSCVGNHASNNIMCRFYHKSIVEEKPAILGLTASPVVNSKMGNLETLETNLNAISRTPKLHREEMLKYVQKPEVMKLLYSTNNILPSRSAALNRLQEVFYGLDIEHDPWVIKMRSDPATCNSRDLSKALISHKTYCHDQIRSLYDKAKAIGIELGPSATEYYIQQCIQKFQRGSPDDSFTIDLLDNEEKSYIQSLLDKVYIPVSIDGSTELSEFSPKVWALIDFLRKQESQGFSGLIFARTRADVAVLSHILTVHVPSFAVSTFVGVSSFTGRKNTIGELVDVKNQKGTLDDLRQGVKNLIITTSALEEGIDVSSCSVVICFEKPPNLKSFIQRRGRARRSNSKYVILLEYESEDDVLTNWDMLEAGMRKLYEDDMRLVHEMQTFEASEDGERTLSIESTGANLTLDDAVQHLYHFCATLPAAPYADLNPIFTFEGHSPNRNEATILATVDLPNSIDASVRHASGICRWRTEKMAKRDAAFEAYKALYNAGLVNDNLLPLGHVDQDADEAYAAVEKRPSLVELSDQVNPWIAMAKQWQQTDETYCSTIRIRDDVRTLSEMMVLLPRKPPDLGDIGLHWDANTTFRASIEDLEQLDPNVRLLAMESTSILLRSMYRNTIDDRDDFLILFLPPDTEDLTSWILKHRGVTKAIDLCESDLGDNAGLIRDSASTGVRYVFKGRWSGSAGDVLNIGLGKRKWHDVASQDETMEQTCSTGNNDDISVGYEDRDSAIPLLEVTRLPKKVDFLHQSPSQDARIANQSKTQTVPAQRCEMDRLPLKYAHFAMFIPSILHRIQVALVVEELCNGLLSPLQLQDRGLVTTAISASSANEPTDYQRQEFLGDSYLKYLTSLTLMAQHLNYHEGILSHKKDHIVSNSSLASAAIKTGLDRYILTKAFIGNKWRPLYKGLLIDDKSEGKREISSKTLADVVEALVGAAFLDGGETNSLACLDIFLPDVPWLTPSRACQVLYEAYEFDVPPSSQLCQIEQLIGYQANLKLLLLEAVTHPSHRGPNSCSSYERLEYLGDAVLDNIVTTKAFAHDPPISVHRLHLLRTALVNRHFLGFLCLSRHILQSRADPVVDDKKNISMIEVSYPFCLWQVMRHASPHIAKEQRACVERYKELNDGLNEAFVNGSYYPWTALAQLEPPKFMSDMIESLLGAIYIDSHGSITTCESFLERLGLMDYLRKVMAIDIALLHPKEELGQLANQDKVTYELGKEGEGGEQKLCCRINVGEKEIVRVSGGRGVMEIQTRAADAACNIMRQAGAGSGSTRAEIRR